MPILDGGDSWGLPTGELGVLDGGSPSGLPVGNRGSIDGGGQDGLPFRNDTENVLYLAAREIQDVSGRRWDRLDVLLPYLNLGILEVINLKPDSFVVPKDLPLSEGAIQVLPIEVFELIDFVCNVGADGKIGGVITGIQKKSLDLTVPGWLSVTPDTEVIYGVVDRRDPKNYYIYPPQPASTTQLIRLKVTEQPGQVESIQQELKDLPFDASYQPALTDYIVYRVLSEETTIPNALAKSASFYNKFIQGLGIKTVGEKQSQSEGV
jgi:hypothetical protein